MTTYHGSCHCGANAFEIQATIESLTVCDCTICAKTAYLHVYVNDENFRLLQGNTELETYVWGTGRARHHFCGISAFRRPRSDPELLDVNARCLGQLDLESLPIGRFLGQDWEKSEAADQLADLRRGPGSRP